MATETTKKKQTANKKASASRAKTPKTSKNGAAKSTSTDSKTTRQAITAAPAVSETSVSTAAATPSASTPSTSVGAGGKFKRWGLWLGVLYLLQGLAIVLFGNNASAPLTTQYFSVDTLASDANGHQVVASAMRHLHDVRLAWVIAVVLALFAAVHFVMAYATQAWHEDALKRGVNPLRSAALGFGGGAMVVTIALLGGISDIATLVLLFALSIVGALLGLAAETVVTRDNGAMSRFSHLLCGLSIVSVVLPWVVFAGQIVAAMLFNGHIPGYVYGVYGSMFVLFMAGVWATHQRIVRSGKWADAAYAETAFLILMLVGASALAWQTFAGAMR
ncbi:MAG TPA: heliorhodopsin HeR [Candidatus Saccharimonadales bacterium]|nr:heliorhodopsin HeR [Candidatus Saccharimonadales bacterium]